MLLSEFKSKEILAQYSVPIPAGKLARTAEEAEAACAGLDARKYVVKAQITAGGRGLAGGIRFAATPSSVRDEAAAMLGSRLVTEQTGEDGELIEAVSVEAALELSHQRFIAFALDPINGAPLLLASAEGGVKFEQQAQANSDLVKSMALPEDTPQARSDALAFLSQFDIDQTQTLNALFGARQAFIDYDATLLEMNPFALTKEQGWVAVDAKIAIDPNALFRHPEFDSMSIGEGALSPEAEAQKSNINLVQLEGNIGVVVNGAGLGLATHDMMIDAGVEPANFMDIRTTASSFDIAKGVELLLQDPKVKAILLNVHGGGMTSCDTVAEGVAFAYSRSKRKVPVISRLAGLNAPWGMQIIQDRKVPVESFETMPQAIQRVVELAQGSAR